MRVGIFFRPRFSWSFTSITSFGVGVGIGNRMAEDRHLLAHADLNVKQDTGTGKQLDPFLLLLLS